MSAYAIGIVAHVDRHNDAEALAAATGAQIVSEDDGTLGAGGNHVKVLKELYETTGADWLVVLEDDSIPVEGFREQLQMVLAVAPVNVVSLYCGTGYPFQYQALFETAIANNPEACWLIHAQLRHGVAYCVRRNIARGLLIRMEDLVQKRYAPDDAITWWAMRSKEPVGYTNPSIVDHKDDSTVIDTRMHVGHPTTPGRKLPRKAYGVGPRLVWTADWTPVRPYPHDQLPTVVVTP